MKTTKTGKKTFFSEHRWAVYHLYMHHWEEFWTNINSYVEIQYWNSLKYEID